MLLLLGVGNRAALLTKLVDNDDVILFKVLDESMEIIDLETTASVIATLEGYRIRIREAIQRDRRVLTSSSSRSNMPTALIMEPWSLSKEEDTFPHLKSLGLWGVSVTS